MTAYTADIGSVAESRSFAKANLRREIYSRMKRPVNFENVDSNFCKLRYGGEIDCVHNHGLNPDCVSGYACPAEQHGL